MENKEEIWKDVIGHEGKYMVSSIGRIKSLKLRTIHRERIMVNGIGTRGYPEIKLWGYNGKRKGFSIHRLVAIAFIPNELNLACVNHIDGNKMNNRVENLEWCTYQENTIHGFRSGLISSKKSAMTKHVNLGKRIKNYDTGEIYSSLQDCISKLKLHKTYISSMLTGYKKNTRNIHYI